KEPSAAAATLDRAVHSRASATGCPLTVSTTAPRTPKPGKAKGYQAAAPTTSMAIGSGLNRGSPPNFGRCRRRRRRYAELARAATDEYENPRFEYMQTGNAYLRMSWGREMAVITISRHPGSLGDTIARALADR